MISWKRQTQSFSQASSWGQTQSPGRKTNVISPVGRQLNTVTLVLKAFPRVPTCWLCMLTCAPWNRYLCNDREREASWESRMRHGEIFSARQNVLVCLERQEDEDDTNIVFVCGFLFSRITLLPRRWCLTPWLHQNHSHLPNTLHCQTWCQIRRSSDLCQFSGSLAELPNVLTAGITVGLTYKEMKTQII